MACGRASITTLPQFSDVDSVPEKVAEVLVSLTVPATNPEESLFRLVPPDSEPNVPLLPPRPIPRVKQSYQVVDQVLRYAICARRLTVNPAIDVDLPGIREAEKRYLTMRQVHELAIAAGRFRTLVFVLALCGLRFGEATALRRKHVDLNSTRIWVGASAAHVAGKGIVENRHQESRGPQGAHSCISRRAVAG